jgi:hypothetical protein
MRNLPCLLLALFLLIFAPPASPQAQKQFAQSPKIQSAKTVYFDDRTGADAVGNAALAQLKKWGRFQIVEDRHQADLIFLLSTSAYRGGYIVPSNGTDSSMHVRLDPVVDSGWHAPVRACFLTVIEPTTGESLWSDSHVWGGLLTGKNSAGERLVKELQKEMKK